MVLTHLILNDMMKVRSHISQLALRLQDDDPRIASLAQLFFHELSRKAFKVHAPWLALSHPYSPCPPSAPFLPPPLSHTLAWPSIHQLCCHFSDSHVLLCPFARH